MRKQYKKHDSQNSSLNKHNALLKIHNLYNNKLNFQASRITHTNLYSLVFHKDSLAVPNLLLRSKHRCSKFAAPSNVPART